MEKIRTSQRNKVLIKTGLLIISPPVALLVAMLLWNEGGSICLFSPSRGGYFAKYIMEHVYPVSFESRVSVSVGYEGGAKIQTGDTITWEGVVETDGKYYESENSAPCFTLFWTPVYYKGIQPFGNQWSRMLTESSLIDLNGFFGPPGKIYGIAIKNKAGGWYTGEWDVAHGRQAGEKSSIQGKSPILCGDEEIINHDDPRKVIFFLGDNNSFVGKATYDATSGLLISAVSFVNNGLSLSLDSTNFSTRRFGKVLIPFVMLAAVILALYEMFWSSLREGNRDGSIPAHIEFAFLGYTAVLVDVYYDFFVYYMAGDAALLGLHVVLVALFWFRLGWWSALPAMEVVFALIVGIIYGDFHSIFTYFPGSLGAWFLALMIQGRVSPGLLPNLPQKKG